jgi:hypothetical protein
MVIILALNRVVARITGEASGQQTAHSQQSETPDTGLAVGCLAPGVGSLYFSFASFQVIPIDCPAEPVRTG